MIGRWVAMTAVAFIGMGVIGRSPRSAPAFTGEQWAGTGDEHLVLNDGEVRGSDGCNGILGSYSVDGDRLSFSLGISTLKACLGVDTWLRRIRSAEISGDTMTVFDRDGAQIGTLLRRA
ncbi:META domain-containing protein [Microbacterium sp. ru370.1]|uniref:META domain-containing protein n=1 Tax=unclassified Microbacterium TaxID=2609290 RepID=UPI0008844845|nr:MULTISPECIES: META domain-containing protein [unclassified Microbacterium]SDO98266.1 META domain-containing protein [Microbacterium sp. ru370.1]SIT92602.1 META domain-containing protein [Microbacterium sp. RU1D]